MNYSIVEIKLWYCSRIIWIGRFLGKHVDNIHKQIDRELEKQKTQKDKN